MSLRTRLLLYLVAVHVVAGAIGVAVYLQHPAWLFAIEAVLVGSLALGIGLVGRLFRAFAFLNDSAQFLEDSDFTSRFLPAGQPEIDRLIGVYNRMVDSLRAERQRVQEQHAFLAHVLDVSPSGILIMDFDGRIAALNPAAVRLAQRDGRSLVGGRPGETGVALFDALSDIPAGESRVLPIVSGRRIRVQHGRFMEHGFARSFFLLEELTEELRKGEKAAYEKLIRMMSHEVNNSVAAASSLLQSSLGYAPSLAPADRADFERALQIAIDRMGQLNVFMRGFADVVRLPAPARRETDVVEMLDRLEGLTRARRDAQRIQWIRAYPPEPVRVAVDAAQFEQALLNVIVNAIDAVDRDGTITVRLAAGERVTLAVEDSGPGVPPEARDQIFTPFFTTKANGQGIGLTLVQEILTNHGFDYALESPPGGPTRFSILM